MKKRLFVVTLLSLAIGLSLSGCSGKVSKTTTAPTPPPSNVKTISLVEQVRNSQHFKMFPTSIKEKERSSKFDYEDACLRCHSEVAILVDKNAKMNDFFAGGKYANQRGGITCIVCHTFSGEKMVNLRNPGWNSCTVCHTGGSITLGKEVHHPQKEMIEGIGVGDVKTQPSYKWVTMKNTFTCIDCHTTNGQKHDFMVPGVTVTYDQLGTTRLSTKMDWNEYSKIFMQEKCITCHYNPEKIVSKVQTRQTEIANKLEALKPKFESWQKKIASLDPKNPQVQQFNNALTYYSYVKADASKGAHNYELAKALLDKAEAEINKLR